MATLGSLAGRRFESPCGHYEADFEVCATDFDEFMRRSLLEPLGTTALLVALLVLIGERRWAPLVAGVALGAGGTVKIFPTTPGTLGGYVHVNSPCGSSTDDV